MRITSAASVIALGIGVGTALLVGCAGSSAPRIETGAAAVRTPDGLYKVDNVSPGTLFVQPDYTFGTYHEFTLGKTVVTFKKGSRVLEKGDLRHLTSIFEAVAREAIKRTGRREAVKPATCVALVNLALVDLEITGSSRTGGVDSYGAVTLVLEIRDGHTRQPLLRYGQRRRLGGAGTTLTTAFQRFAATFQKDFNRSLPRSAEGAPAMSCTERAGG